MLQYQSKRSTVNSLLTDTPNSELLLNNGQVFMSQRDSLKHPNSGQLLVPDNGQCERPQPTKLLTKVAPTNGQWTWRLAYLPLSVYQHYSLLLCNR